MEKGRKDLAVISPQGKRGNLIESLMKQKMSIMEQKDALISSSKKDGKSMESIKSQLEVYEKQLKDVEEQISQAMTKEMEKQTGKAKKGDEPETKQEIENKRLANVMDLSLGLQKAEMVSSVKARVDGEACVLKSEIELDKLHDPSEETSKEIITEKESQLADLEQKSNELLSDIGEIIGETTEKVEEQNEDAVSALKQKKGFDLPTKNEQDRRDLVQLSSQAKKAALIENGMAKIHVDSEIENSRIDDFRKEELMADYSRLQGGYLSDAIFGILGMESARDVYDECIANGMTEEEASEKYQEKLLERFGHYQEALALALEFIPLDEDATGELISYSDVYDENGQLKVPVKLTFEEYHRNLQNILENMMDALKDRKDDFPNLYKIYFGE